MVKHVKIVKTLLKVTKIDDQKEGEDRNKFLERLYEAAHILDQDVWESLPLIVQDWVNAATEAGNEKKELPDPDAKSSTKTKAKVEDDVEEPGEDTTDDDESADDDCQDESEEDDDADEPDNAESDDDEESSNETVATEEDSDVETHTSDSVGTRRSKKTAKASTKKAAQKGKPATKPAKKASVGRGGEEGPGAQTLIKIMMLKDPNITTEDLIDKLTKKGLKPTKVAVTSIRSGMRHTMRVMADAGVLHHTIKFGA